MNEHIVSFIKLIVLVNEQNCLWTMVSLKNNYEQWMNILYRYEIKNDIFSKLKKKNKNERFIDKSNG